jgi:hypothetical protein
MINPAASRGSSHRTKEDTLLDDVFLQPWFLDNRTARSIRRLIPELFFHKMRFYFEDWGCLMCEDKNSAHFSNGMCRACVNRIRQRLLGCLKKRRIKLPEFPAEKPMSGEERVRSARIMLSDLARGEWSPNRMRLRQIRRRD